VIDSRFGVTVMSPLPPISKIDRDEPEFLWCSVVWVLRGIKSPLLYQLSYAPLKMKHLPAELLRQGQAGTCVRRRGRLGSLLDSRQSAVHVHGKITLTDVEEEEYRMAPASVGRGLLLTGMVASVACSDLSLRRSADSALADTIPETATSPARSREPRPKPSRAGIESASFAEIRRALRRLVAAEETFFAENGTYTEDLPLSKLAGDSATSIRFLWLSRDGWAASGTHPALPGRDCVIFVGKAEAPPTTLKYVRPGRVGVPVCDDRSTPPKPAAVSPAQAAPPVSDTANTLDRLDPRVVMKVDLRNLAHSQETYLAMQGTYARRTESLALQYLWHRDVRVKILTADEQSWTAKATHARFPGKSCVIWYGALSQRPRTDAQQRAEGRAGVPVCDD
jgi:hypothetical protein